MRGEHDVVVVGAGPGGIGAAVAAARLGLDVLVVERCGFPGGVATTACCPYLMGFAAGGRQIAGGVAEELVRELAQMDEARFPTDPDRLPDPEPIGDRPLLNNVLTSVEGVRVAANRLITRAGATRLFYTSLVGACRDNGALTDIAIDNADGPGRVRARVFVDATGDANLVWRAGGGVRVAAPDESMTKTILVRVGGVKDFRRTRIHERYERLFKTGAAPFPNQDHFMGMALLHPGEALLNFPLVAGDALSAADLTRMDAELREQALLTVTWFREHFPEFEEAFLLDVGPGVGVRAGRGMVGLETITCADLDEGTPVAEPVAIGTRSYGGHGIDRFTSGWAKSNPGLRGIPLRALLSADLNNVVAAGRAISAEPKTLTSFRLMARCMAIGQAAGTLAALAVRQDRSPRDVPYAVLRQHLLDHGAILE